MLISYWKVSIPFFDDAKLPKFFLRIKQIKSIFGDFLWKKNWRGFWQGGDFQQKVQNSVFVSGALHGERAGVPLLSYCHWSIYFFSPPMRGLYSLLCWVNFQLLILWTRIIWNQYFYQQQWIPEAALAKMLCSFKNTIDAIPIDKYYFRGSWCEQDKWYMKSIRGREIFQD